ncbi:unnamed protein product [Rhizophagus irregularis]|uniref:R3H domain-containing protein n=1 Tax=Rhizophagus irregularis TaxID=588596 RepID=A0A915ZWN8_9GLOM|nr:unnamed protein product [Rhizophagus irregularis]CAB5184324.1 unnamed protein product [Rhizophagus irregularis]CAB5389988.1 unnamed protein product [Rhizophagus irregularis]
MSENEIDLDDLDISDKEEFLESLKEPKKLALEICPVETWTQIISYLEDIPTLTSLSLTCSTLRVLTKQQLLSQMVTIPSLNKLYLFTKNLHPEFTNQNDITFKMHKYIDKVVIEESGVEPSKWTDNMYEWDGYNQLLDDWKNQEDFSKSVGKKGKAKNKSYIEWEKNVENKKKFYRRELAKCWAVAGKFFPFSHAENREWKKKRQDKTSTDDNNELPPEEKESKSNHSQKQPSKHHQRHQMKSQSVNQKPPKAPRRKDLENKMNQSKNSDNNKWKFSHEIRNQPKPRRPNIGKGEEDFNRTILTNYVTPKNFNSGVNFEGYSHDDLTTVMIKMLKRFDVSDERVLKFPKELSAYQRKQLHRQAEIRGLKSISFGEGDGRFLVVMRQDVEDTKILIFDGAELSSQLFDSLHCKTRRVPDLRVIHLYL